MENSLAPERTVSSDVDKFISKLLMDLKNNRLTLPTLPQVAIRVNNVIKQPNVTATKVSKVVGTDAALTIKLIQVANSPLMRGSKNIEDLRSAVTRMGLSMVRNIVSTLLIKQLFHTKYPALKKRMESVWRTSTNVAAISYVLANKYTRLNPNEAMLGGLVHNIGVLPILAYAEKYPKIVRKDSFLDGIIDKLSVVIGKTILETWKFLPELITVAAEHNNLQRNSSDVVDYTDVVIVARLHSQIGDSESHHDIPWDEIPAFTKLGLSPDESIATLQEAGEEIKEIKKLLSG